MHVGEIEFGSCRPKSDRAVHGPRIDIGETQLSGDLPGDRAFTGACRPIDRDYDAHTSTNTKVDDWWPWAQVEVNGRYFGPIVDVGVPSVFPGVVSLSGWPIGVPGSGLLGRPGNSGFLRGFCGVVDELPLFVLFLVVVDLDSRTGLDGAGDSRDSSTNGLIRGSGSRLVNRRALPALEW